MVGNRTFQEHLALVNACPEARAWAGYRTAQEAWDQCERPEWLLWWVMRDRPELRPQGVRLIVRELRARTLPLCREQDIASSTAALDAAEAWAANPCAEAERAASAARAAALAAVDAYDAAHSAAAAAASACTYLASASSAAAAAYASAAAYDAAGYDAYAVETDLWLTAIRNEFDCPWEETS